MQSKHAVLHGVVAQCDHHPIAVDLNQDWVSLLLNQGFQVAMPSVWLLEGLLMYLHSRAVERLFQTISTLSTSGSWLGADLISVQSLQVGLREGDRVRKHWQFGTDEPEQLFATYGWQATVVQPGEEGVTFGRYHGAPPPRALQHKRRSFLVTASC